MVTLRTESKWNLLVSASIEDIKESDVTEAHRLRVPERKRCRKEGHLYKALFKSCNKSYTEVHQQLPRPRMIMQNYP